MQLHNKQFSDINALVVGDVMLDRYWFGSVERISPEAPVPVLSVNQQEVRAGGAANVAHNLQALGAKTTLLSVVGDDQAGTEIKQLIQDYGAEPKLIVDNSISTIVKLRMIAQNHQLLRADFDEEPSDEVLAQCLQDYERLLPDSDVVILSDYGKGGLRHVSKMIELARETDVPVIIDPKGSDYSRYSGATLITPNMKEFETAINQPIDDSNFSQYAKGLREQLDLDYLLITRSEKGMSLFTRNGDQIDSPAQAIEIYDVSGAGDTVISLMALALVSNFTNEQTLQIANAAAGIVVGKLGTAVATIEEVIDRLKANS